MEKYTDSVTGVSITVEPVVAYDYQVMREHNELINLVLKHFDRLYRKGLCHLFQSIYSEGLMTFTEWSYLEQHLEHNKPGLDDRLKWYPYYWPCGVPELRKQWLKEQLWEPEPAEPQLDYPQ